MIKLKPCPFCGYSFPKLEEKSKTFYKGEQVYNTYVRCPACDTRGRRAILSHFPTNKKAREYVMEAWNRRSSDWISVKDRLPEEGENILIFVNDLKSEPVQADVCYYDGDEAWLDSGYNFGSDVPYWMPLPKPPEVNENDEP